MLTKIQTQYQESAIISVVNQRKNGKKNILIYLMCLNFILYFLPNRCFATDNISFISIQKLIDRKDHRGITYSPSQKTAIINPDYGSAVYIDFVKKRTYSIIGNWPNIAQEWLSDSVVHITGSCGTGCAQSIIFIAPATIISCPTHEYRITSLNPREPPDYYSNRPLLIDTKKGIYVCYDDENNIQTLPLTTYPTIRPPKGYFGSEAEIKNGKLVITYENKAGKVKHVSYGKI